MAIFRGTGGQGDSTTDTTVTTVTQKAAEAASSATSAATSATAASNSATSAETSATNAATSETNAANSATASATSATASETAKTAAQAAQTAAETAETNAETAETNAETAQAAAEAAQAAAETAQTNAETAETNAETAETNAETAYANTLAIFGDAQDVQDAVDDAEKLAVNPEDSQYTLSDSVTTGYSALHYAAKAEDSAALAQAGKDDAETASDAATVSSTLAATYASNASDSADDAAVSASQALTYKNAAENRYDLFNDRFLGQITGDPDTDNNGDPLITGALYFNSIENEIRVYTGSAWEPIQELSGDQTVNSLTSNNDVVVKGNLEVQGTTITVDSATAQTIDLGDNDKIRLGDSDDLQIYHDGSKSVIQDSGAGTLDISTNGSAIRLVQGNGNRLVTAGYGTAGVKLWYGSDDTEKLATTSAGVDVTGNITVSGTVDGRDIAADGTTLDAVASTYVDVSGDTLTGDLAFGDNVKATFGASDDLQIYHDGSNSTVRDAGTGQLYLGTNGSFVGLYDYNNNQDMLRAFTGGDVIINQAGSERFRTTSTGVDVTGTVVADGLTVDTDTLYVDATNNRVGIGTTSPLYNLDINDTNAVAIIRGTTATLMIAGDTENSGASEQDARLIFTSDAQTNASSLAHGFELALINDEPGSGLKFYNHTSSTEAMRINSSGYVGIGTTTPATTLEVVGTVTADKLKIDSGVFDINLEGSLAALPADNDESHIFTTSGSGSGFFAKYGALGLSSRNKDTASSDIGFFTDKLLRVEIADGGDILFYEDTGTTAKLTWDASAEELQFKDNVSAYFGDGNDLQIYHNGTNTFLANYQGDLFVNNYSNDKDIKLRTDDGSGGLTDYLIADGSTGEVQLFHYGSEKLSTKSTGIDVTGTVTADGLTVDGEIILDSATGNHFLKFYRSDSSINAGNALGQILFGGSDDGDFPDAASIQASAATNWTATSSATQLDFFTTRNTTVTPVKRLTVADSGDISFYDDSGTSEDLYWDASTSRLGLGVTSPSHQLQLGGSSDSTLALFRSTTDTAQILIRDDDTLGYFGARNNFIYISPTSATGADGLVVRTDTGNVGIGTTAPDSLFHISSGGPKITITDTTFNADATITVNDAGSLTFSADANNERTNSRIQFDVDGSEAMRIDSSGRLGIGTTSPSTTLHVKHNGGGLRLQGESSDLYGAYVDFAKEAGTRRGLFGYTGSGTSLTIQNDESGDIRFNNNGSEAARIDSSGNLLVGRTATWDFSTASTTGIGAQSGGTLFASRNSGASGYFRRNTNDGDIVELWKDTSKVGSIGVDTSDIVIDGSSLHSGLRFFATNISPRYNLASSDNGIDLGASTRRFKDLYLSGGVYLGGTGSANLLDDYEEGTWTPALAFGGGSTGITYSSRDGHYIKIGNQVTVHGSIILSNKGSSTGGATVQSLPFTVGSYLSGTTLEAGGIVPYSADFTGALATGGISVSATDGATELKLKELQQSGTVTNDLEEYHFQNTTTFRFSITYFA